MTKFIMMVGLVGSGKSYIARTILKDYYNAEIMSSDALRKEEYGDEKIQGDNVALFALLYERMFEALESGQNVIFDATNVATKYRRHLLSKMAKMDVRKIAYVVATPYDECLVNNDARERKVPVEIIKRMREGFFIPFYEEGWDEISMHWNVRDGYPDLKELFAEMDEFDQENPNHTLTLGGHIRAAYSDVAQYGTILGEAARLHDIGKVDTKVFTTMKGEPKEHASYYHHENVGAYNAMFYLKKRGWEDGFILAVCKLIQFHMRPYHSTSPRAVRKLIGQIGQYDYTELLKMNAADRAAH